MNRSQWWIDRILYFFNQFHSQLFNSSFVYRTLPGSPTRIAAEGPITYIPTREKMPSIPTQYLSPADTPASECFLIYANWAEILLQRHHKATPERLDDQLARELAVQAIWQKVQWQQQQAKHRSIKHARLLLHSSDYCQAASGRCDLSPSYWPTLGARMERHFDELWWEHGEYFSAEYYGEAGGRWVCCRVVEQLTVSLLTTRICNLKDVEQFLKNLQLRMYNRALHYSPRTT